MLLDLMRLAMDIVCSHCELGYLFDGSRLETWAISYEILLTELCKADGRRNGYK